MNDQETTHTRIIKTPIFAFYFLIASTLFLSLVILAYIWFPNLIADDIFWKAFVSYLTLIFSTLVISYITQAMRNVENAAVTSPKKKKDKQED